MRRALLLGGALFVAAVCVFLLLDERSAHETAEPGAADAAKTERVPGLLGSGEPKTVHIHPGEPEPRPPPGTKIVEPPPEERTYVRIAGRVLDPQDRPIAGARVRAWSVDGGHLIGDVCETDQDGRFAVDRAPSNQPVRLVARTDRLAPRGILVSVPADTDDVILRLGGGGVLQGTVTDHTGAPGRNLGVHLLRPGQPIPPRARGVTHHIGHAAEYAEFQVQATKTDERGQYRFGDVPLAATREVSVRVSDAYEARAEPVRFTEAGERKTRDVRLPGPAAITITLVSDDGTRIDDAQVNLCNQWAQLDEDEGEKTEGEWRFSGLSPGDYQVFVWVESGMISKHPVTLAPLADRRHEIVIPRGLEIAGVAVDGDGNPVPGARIWWTGDGDTGISETDRQGRFRVTGIRSREPGRLTVRTDTPPGRRPLADIYVHDVVPGGEPLRIVLKPLGRLTARFPGVAVGTELRMGAISKSLWGGGNRKLREGEVFEHDVPVAHEPFLLVFRHGGFAPLVVDCKSMEPGVDLALGDLRFDEGFTLDGVLENEKGEPLSFARVSLAEKWHHERFRTDARGRFQFRRLPKRVMCLRVDAESYPMTLLCIDGQAFDPGERLVVRPGGHVNGRVLLPSGEPAPGCDVVVIPWTTSPYDQDHDKTRQHFETNAEGRFRAHLQSGAWRVEAYGPKSEGKGSSRADVREGETAELEIRLK